MAKSELKQPEIELSKRISDEIKTTTCYMCACRCGHVPRPWSMDMVGTWTWTWYMGASPFTIFGHVPCSWLCPMSKAGETGSDGLRVRLPTPCPRGSRASAESPPPGIAAFGWDARPAALRRRCRRVASVRRRARLGCPRARR